MPIPLALMIPFMATQSLVMGESFGKAFQFGKRKISAMSNEDFNKLTIEQVASEMFASYKNIEQDLKTSMDQSTALQNYIVSKIISIPIELIQAWVHAGHGHTAEHDQPSDTFVSDPHKFLSEEEQIQHYRHGHQDQVAYRPTPQEPTPEPTLTPEPHPPEPIPTTTFIENVYISMRATAEPTTFMFMDFMKRQWFPLAYPTKTFVSYRTTAPPTSSGSGSEKIWYVRGTLGYY